MAEEKDFQGKHFYKWSDFGNKISWKYENKGDETRVIFELNGIAINSPHTITFKNNGPLHEEGKSNTNSTSSDEKDHPIKEEFLRFALTQFKKQLLDKDFIFPAKDQHGKLAIQNKAKECLKKFVEFVQDLGEKTVVALPDHKML